MSRIVIDTCVLKRAYHGEDDVSGRGIESIKRKRHTVVVCPSLFWEYVLVLSNGDRSMYRVIYDLLWYKWLRLPREERLDPNVRISFGPPEDRLHMQLAIDSGAQCHVSTDNGVLAEACNMRQYGVTEVHPANCVPC